MHQNAARRANAIAMTANGQCGRVSPQVGPGSFRSLAAVLSQLATSPDSLIPSRIADLMMRYVTHALISDDTSPIAVQKMTARVNASSSALKSISSPVVRSWPFIVGDAQASGGASVARGADCAARVVHTPHGNHGDNLSLSGAGGKNDQA